MIVRHSTTQAMTTEWSAAAAPRVLVLGGTGRTGRRVIAQLLERGCDVRAIVRSTPSLPRSLMTTPALSLVIAPLLSLTLEELRRHVRGCDAIISCLGHTISIRGIFGQPRDLVSCAIARVVAAVEAERPARPVRLVVMSSVSVNHPGMREPRRSTLERGLLAVLRGLVPPARDNQRTADLLWQVGREHPRYVDWVAVRPDTLLVGPTSRYVVHEQLVDPLTAPGHTRMANVAHFMCELVTSDEVWERWRGSLPVIADAARSRAEPDDLERPAGWAAHTPRGSDVVTVTNGT